MPIYPYRCEACGEVVEVWAKMDDPPPEACEKCGQGPMTRAVARTAFHLKGGGWYAQGYSGGAKKSAAPSTSSDGGSSASSTSSSSSSTGSTGSTGSTSSGGGSGGGSSDSSSSST